MPLLAKTHTVICRTCAARAALQSPKAATTRKYGGGHSRTSEVAGIQSASIVGHDIGLMVAYAYAAQFSAETERVVRMDAIADQMNGRPRKTLGWATPLEAYRAMLVNYQSPSDTIQ
ncbi:MAG: hypothetical protein ACREXG_10025 [Polaromonas sp.]